jgi:hypothetical protein
MQETDVFRSNCLLRSVIPLTDIGVYSVCVRFNITFCRPCVNASIMFCEFLFTKIKSTWYKYEALKDRFTWSSMTHSNWRTLQEERSNDELSTARLSVKSMVMCPMYTLRITCWSFKTSVCMYGQSHTFLEEMFSHMYSYNVSWHQSCALFSHNTSHYTYYDQSRTQWTGLLRWSNANISWLQYDRALT